MGVWGNCSLPPILWRSKMKEAIKSKKGIMAIVSILIALFAAIWQNGGLDGIIIDVPGSDPIEVNIPESCEDCEEACKCDIDDRDCICDASCACPICA